VRRLPGVTPCVHEALDPIEHAMLLPSLIWPAFLSVQ
jgi:hypothetical protein